MMITILVFDTIFLDQLGALASATIYTILLGVILAYNRERVTKAFRALVLTERAERKARRERGKLALVAVLPMGVLFAFDQALVTLPGHGKG